jgi:hypothetical protein
MKMRNMGCVAAVLMLLASPHGRAFAQDAVVINDPYVVTTQGQTMIPASAGGGGSLSDLTLFNFFSAGWDEDSSRRVRETGTPDYALLKVQTNFMEREFRVNYFYEPAINSAKRDDLNNMDAIMAWAFNRRFMIEVKATDQWFDDRGKTADQDGTIASLVGRLQLIDTESSSYSFNFQVNTPNRGTGQTQATYSYGLAGFEDLGYWLKLNKVGFYYSFLFDSLDGPNEVGATRNDVQYDIAIAKTLVAQDVPLIGGLTPFVEFFAQTNLDGATASQTVVTITPAVRFNLGKSDRVNFGKDNWILFGVDIPVSGPRPYDAVYRLTYIKNF